MSALKITVMAGSLLLAFSMFAFANRIADLRTLDAPENRLAANPKQENQEKGKPEDMSEDNMQFGNFSVSLAVKDLKTSKAFYEKLDFKHTFGKLEQNYVIMQNGTATIGLFQGMFEKNILTFNPGWDRNAETLDKFQDVRELQATLKKRGITPTLEAKAGEGPASFVIVDPDGNSILVDQHVPKSE